MAPKSFFYYQKNRALLGVLMVLVSFVAAYALVTQAFKYNTDRYIEGAVKNIFSAEGDVIANYALVAPDLLKKKVTSLLANFNISEIYVYKNGKLLHKAFKHGVSTVSHDDDNRRPLKVYEGHSGGDVITVYAKTNNDIRKLSQSLIFFTMVFLFAGVVFIFAMLYYVFVLPASAQTDRIINFVNEFKRIYRDSSSKDRIYFMRNAKALSRRYLQDEARYDYEDDANSVIDTVSSISADLEKCIHQKESILYALKEHDVKREQAQQAITRFSHDINHPLNHIEIIGKNVFSSIASQDYKNGLLSAINLLIVSTLASIKPKAFLHIEKVFSSDGFENKHIGDKEYSLFKPTYQCLSEYFLLDLMMVYTQRIYQKNFILRIDDDLLLNSCLSIPVPEIAQSIIYNLVSNALTHGGDKKVVVTISRYSDEEGDFLKIDVDGVKNKFPEDVVKKVMSHDPSRRSYIDKGEVGGFGLILTKDATRYLGGRLELKPGSTYSSAYIPVKIKKCQPNQLQQKKVYVAGRMPDEMLSILKFYLANAYKIACSTVISIEPESLCSSHESDLVYVLSKDVLDKLQACSYSSKATYLTNDVNEFIELSSSLPDCIRIESPAMHFLAKNANIDNLFELVLSGIQRKGKEKKEAERVNTPDVKALLIDDQPAFALDLISMIHRDNPQIHFDYAQNLEEALDLIESAVDEGDPYNAYVCDMMLDNDKIGGAAAAKAIKEKLAELCPDRASKQKPMFFAISAGKAMVAEAETLFMWDGIFQKGKRLEPLIARLVKNKSEETASLPQHGGEDQEQVVTRNPESFEVKEVGGTTNQSGFISELVRDVRETADLLEKDPESIFSDIDVYVEQMLQTTTNAEAASVLHKLAGKIMLYSSTEIGERLADLSDKYEKGEPLLADDIEFLKRFVERWKSFRETGFV